MIKVGILPTAQLNEKDTPYNDIYYFQNELAKRIYEVGALPIGIILNNGELDIESLKMCDALLLGGGKKITKYSLQAINYAIENNIPFLGICLGMQTIGVYSYLEERITNKGQIISNQTLIDEYQKIKEEKIQFLKPVENHYNEKITRTNKDTNKHQLKIINGTILHDIYKQDVLDVISLHRYALNKYGSNVIINCTNNNIIEGIEFKEKNKFILGLQWHPELEKENNIIFKKLVEEANKRYTFRRNYCYQSKRNVKRC